MKSEIIKKHIQENYSKIAKNVTPNGCCSKGCCCSGTQNDIYETSLNIGYSGDDLTAAPADSNMGLGCGNPTSIAALTIGEYVLDLGCGGGFDCFLARRKIGEKGFVIGVDMTPDMVHLARENVIKSGYKNIDIRLGEIEHLPVENETIDVIISNCVINLSTDKRQVFKEAFRVLKRGGRLSISDVVATAELPEKIKENLAMMSGCIAGAEYVENIARMLSEVGFEEIKMIPKDNSKEIITSWQQGENVENYVASYTIEAVKK